MSWWGGGPGAALGGGGSGSGYLVSDLIDEARTLIDDDHDEDDGYITPARWIRWLNWERMSLARRSMQLGKVRAPTTDTEFTGYTTDLDGAMAIVAVWEDVGGPRFLRNEQWRGAEPFFSSYPTGKSNAWAAYGAGDNFTVELYPRDAAGTYNVRWVPQIAYASDVANLVLVPQGFERRLVYGMASHALIKESGRSAALNEKIREADAELGFALIGRNGEGPRVRNNREARRAPLVHSASDPRSWFYG